MKYRVSFYYDRGGIAIIDIPRLHGEDIFDYLDEDDTVVRAVVELGLDVFYPYDAVYETFLADSKFHLEEYGEPLYDGSEEERFWQYTAELELMYIEDMEGYIQYTGLEMKPVPPHYKVGIIEQNQNPLFQHYRGTRR